MSNTSQIPEGDQDLVADFMARFTKESTSLIEADFLAEFDIRFSVENESYRLQLTRVNNSPSQKNIKVLEQTIQDQDSQIIAQKKEIERLKELLKSNYQNWHKTFYRTVSTLTESQISNHFKAQWENFAKNNNIQDNK